MCLPFVFATYTPTHDSDLGPRDGLLCTHRVLDLLDWWTCWLETAALPTCISGQ